eukprot:TRINITY_DN890_c0_g1_i1.p1 TRINITY_DN890_c0_g1~~TRINITY_DN890_c0_g1_i1.p1  ORF type:complete len:876 (-),score=156.31 TRINITY_DN890_c0_g1_i1:1075-3504(-)
MLVEYCEKGDLHGVLNREDLTFSWDQIFAWYQQTLAGVRFLHDFEPRIVHRDIKTLNLLVTAANTVKLADFGLSRFTQQSNSMSTLGKLRGTYCYTAPEIYWANPYTTKSDVYSLGVVLWEFSYRVLTGSYSAPYSEFTHISFDFQIIIQAAKKNLRPTIPPNCPPALLEVITGLWIDQPDARPEVYQLEEVIVKLIEEYKRDSKAWDKATIDQSSAFTSTSPRVKVTPSMPIGDTSRVAVPATPPPISPRHPEKARGVRVMASSPKSATKGHSSHPHKRSSRTASRRRHGEGGRASSPPISPSLLPLMSSSSPTMPQVNAPSTPGVTPSVSEPIATATTTTTTSSFTPTPTTTTSSAASNFDTVIPSKRSAPYKRRRYSMPALPRVTNLNSLLSASAKLEVTQEIDSAREAKAEVKTEVRPGESKDKAPLSVNVALLYYTKPNVPKQIVTVKPTSPFSLSAPSKPEQGKESIVVTPKGTINFYSFPFYVGISMEAFLAKNTKIHAVALLVPESGFESKLSLWLDCTVRPKPIFLFHQVKTVEARQNIFKWVTSHSLYQFPVNVGVSEFAKFIFSKARPSKPDKHPLRRIPVYASSAVSHSAVVPRQGKSGRASKRSSARLQNPRVQNPYALKIEPVSKTLANRVKDVYKVLLIGIRGVGKTSFANRVVNGTFDEGVLPSGPNVEVSEIVTFLGAQFQFYSCILETDTPFYKYLLNHTPDITLVMYDITVADSLVAIKQWMSQGSETDFISLGIVGTHSDLEESRQVTAEQGSDLATSKQALFSEVSSKTGENCKEFMVKVLRCLLNIA